MLLIDVGNTSVGLARAADGRTVEALETHPLPQDEAAAEALLAAIEALTARGATGRIAVSSVVPALTDRLRAAHPDAFVVDHRCAFPFALAVSDPAAVGADRYCNMAAAVAEGWSTALVVDAGTATTFDVLHDGVFTGGLIAPGLRLAAEALGARAARLPDVGPEPRILAAEPDTVGAMAGGAFHVGARGVLATLEALRMELDSPPVVLTGGLASLIAHDAAGGSGDWRLDPSWSLRGLLHLASAS